MDEIGRDEAHRSVRDALKSVLSSGLRRGLAGTAALVVAVCVLAALFGVSFALDEARSWVGWSSVAVLAWFVSELIWTLWRQPVDALVHERAEHAATKAKLAALENAERPLRLAVAKNRMRAWTVLLRQLARKSTFDINAVEAARVLCLEDVRTMRGEYGAEGLAETMHRRGRPLELSEQHSGGRQLFRVLITTRELEPAAAYLEGEAAALQESDLSTTFTGREFSAEVPTLENLPTQEEIWLNERNERIDPSSGLVLDEGAS